MFETPEITTSTAPATKRGGPSEVLSIQFLRFVAAFAVVVFHSDGITGRWNLGAYAGLSRRHPAVTASLLYRDFQRGRDDATAVVARLA